MFVYVCVYVCVYKYEEMGAAEMAHQLRVLTARSCRGLQFLASITRGSYLPLTPTPGVSKPSFSLRGHLQLSRPMQGGLPCRGEGLELESRQEEKDWREKMEERTGGL